MIKIKSLIKYDNANCIEVTWVETIEEVETIIHCQAYADVQIGMLRADAEKYGTSLDEYEELIAEVEAGIVLPTDEELQAELIKNQVQEYKAFLIATDYKMTIDYFATLDKETQDSLIAKRATARDFVRTNS